METVRNPLWELDVADGWLVTPEDECCTCTLTDDGGALQISAYRKDSGLVTKDDLLGFDTFPAALLNQLVEGSWGTFSGLYLAYSESGLSWRRWSIGDGDALAFITYNCKVGSEQLERVDVDAMVNSIRTPTRL